MTTSRPDLTALRATAEAVPGDTWTALGTGPAGGDHWHVCNDGEAIASIACQDGINEEEREPLARHIAAFDPPTAIALLDRITELEGERDKAQRACQTLGRIIERDGESIIEATGAHDLLWGDDGDGDWGAIHDRLQGLGTRAIAAEATIQRVREVHDSEGYRYFGRLAGQPLPSPEGEAYCTHCNKAAPCPTVRALGGAE